MFLVMNRWNTKGQLGVGHSSNIGDSSGEMGDNLQDTDLGADFVAIQVTAGHSHSCALSNTSQVKCWG